MPEQPHHAPTSSAPRRRRALVSGGSGFIGSHLIPLLLARGDHVTVVDNLSTGRRANLPEDHASIRFIEADLREALRVLGPGETFDEIYHLAAAVGVTRVLEDPILAIETNVEQTAAILRFASGRGTDGGASPTLIASSSEVYGKAAKTPFSEEDDVLYGPTTVSRWSYAATKAIDEYLALAHHRMHGLPAVVVRFFNTVGPRQVGDYGMVLPRFVAAALRGEPLRVFGDGEQTRCFCDVRDTVRALPTLLGTRACHGRVFNVGSDQPISIAALARLVVRVLASGSEVVLSPYSEAYPSGFEDLRQRRPDLARITEAIGFRPTIPLEQTIKDIAESMLGHGLRETRT